MEMLKRKDGSVSRRGLWDNIRANKGSGKKPTAQMLKQEKKINNSSNTNKMKVKKAETGTPVRDTVKKAVKKVVKSKPTPLQAKNIKDATQMKNMRPTGPKTGRVETTMGSAKNGKSFPDLNKDGKITKADILKGRGVIAKKDASVKKAQNGTLQPMRRGARKVSPNKSKYVSEDGNYKMKFKGGSDTSAPTSAVQRRTLKGFLKGAPKAAGKMALKSGGSMKKCKYGCK